MKRIIECSVAREQCKNGRVHAVLNIAVVNKVVLYTTVVTLLGTRKAPEGIQKKLRQSASTAKFAASISASLLLPRCDV